MLIFLLGILVSCAGTEEEKECKETPWGNYGEKVAMMGLSLEGDALVKKCKKQKLNMDEIAYELGYEKGLKEYCTDKNTFAVGSRGEEFNFQICKFENEDDMRVSHSNGVIVYCNANNAYKLGLAGKVFNNICPVKISKAYKKEFRRGRRKYLMKQINSEQRKIDEIHHQYANLRLKQNRILKDLNSDIRMPPSKRQELSSSVDGIESQIKNLELKKRSIQLKIKDYEGLIIKANQNRL